MFNIRRLNKKIFFFFDHVCLKILIKAPKKNLAKNPLSRLDCMAFLTALRTFLEYLSLPHCLIINFVFDLKSQRFKSSTIRYIFVSKSSSENGLKVYPTSLFSTKLGAQPALSEHKTGIPDARASFITNPHCSVILGKIKQEADL